MLALRLGWTPDEIDAMDPAFLDELTARIAAQSERDRDVAAAKAARAQRRAGTYGGQRGYYEVVNVPIA